MRRERGSTTFLQGAAVGQSWLESGEEPSLEEIYSDPLVRLVMRRDGVTRAHLERVIGQTRASLRRGYAGT
jgi:hypothetical protein